MLSLRIGDTTTRRPFLCPLSLCPHVLIEQGVGSYGSYGSYGSSNRLGQQCRGSPNNDLVWLVYFLFFTWFSF